MQSNKLQKQTNSYNKKFEANNYKPIIIWIKYFPKIFQSIITNLLIIILLVLCPYFQINTNCKISEKLCNNQQIQVSKEDVHILLKSTTSSDLTKKKFTATFDHSPLLVNTSLDMILQKSIINKIDKHNSQIVAIVVMNPDNGKIIVMCGFNKDNPNENPCTISNFPAASIFKIITTAAAIEKCGYLPNSILKFNGSKHTLYKRQIVNSVNRYTNTISLQKSFAQSVNPVFGKMGSFDLGANNLREYGDVFGFNQKISFEIPWNISNLCIKDDPYHWAEIASGFNRETTISPMHGAVIASTIVNGGIPVEPTIIDQILDANGNLIYNSKTNFLDRIISVNTASILKQLMNATITSGTGRKAFQNHKKNNILSRLNIGGKTGSICNRAHNTRFDWFIGFAKNKHGSEKIVVSVVVAHGKYIGTKAGEYARIAIENYFKKCFEQKDQA